MGAGGAVTESNRKVLEKLRRLERLARKAGSEGERAAAEAARRRLVERLDREGVHVAPELKSSVGVEFPAFDRAAAALGVDRSARTVVASPEAVAYEPGPSWSAPPPMVEETAPTTAPIEIRFEPPVEDLTPPVEDLTPPPRPISPWSDRTGRPEATPVGVFRAEPLVRAPSRAAPPSARPAALARTGEAPAPRRQAWVQPLIGAVVALIAVEVVVVASGGSFRSPAPEGRPIDLDAQRCGAGAMESCAQLGATLARGVRLGSTWGGKDLPSCGRGDADSCARLGQRFAQESSLALRPGGLPSSALREVACAVGSAICSLPTP